MQPGDLVDGRFEIERVAGSGGMGTVYRAFDRHSGGPVALKLLDVVAKSEAARFVREAQILASLEHPGIVRYLSHGADGRGRPYLAMEWLEGEDLGARLARGRLSVDEALLLATKVSEALGLAHDNRVVHRDIKPSNLFLPGGVIADVKLLDFGIARLPLGAPAATRPGIILGTPGYMAPEQARGLREITPAADVFSLGCVLWECLTGQPVFWAAHTMAILLKILLEPPPRIAEIVSEVSPSLEDLLERALAKEPSARPQDARELAAELALVCGGQTSRAPRAPGPEGLGTGEQSLVCVILAAPHAEEALGATTLAEGTPRPTSAVADTVESSQPSASMPLVTELGAITREHGGSPLVLLDGSLVVTIRRPGAATDLAAQAARCALAMRAAFPWERIAVATGRAVLGGRVPVGEAIDRAAALVRAVGPAAVRLDDVTCGLLDARFEVGSGPAGLELRGEREEPDETRRLLGRPVPCIGRERELGLLRGIFEQCLAEPMAQPVLLTGPAGIGKSRLRHELIQRARETGPVEVWFSAGHPLAAGSPFGMLAQLLRRAAGLQIGEPPEARRRKLRGRVARHCGANEQVARFLGEVLGCGFDDSEDAQLRAARSDPMLMGDRIRHAWQDFIAAEAAAQPVILVLEDLHWGDLPTVNLIDAALDRARDRALLVLALARPEVHEAFPALWADRGVHEIAVGELTRRSAGRIAREALGPDATDAVVERVVERSSGNPFFLEELVRAVVQGRGEEPPETVLAMLTARIGDLPDETRRVLRAASVFGQSFWREGVEALLGSVADRRAMDGRLADLVEHEIVARRNESRFEGATELAFRHALVRDAAYATLTLQDRTLGHRLAGEWLSRHGESDSMALAQHFEHGGVPEQAVESYRRAAEQALEGNDLHAVLRRTERALRLPGLHRDQVAAFRGLEAKAYFWLGERQSACRSARAAMALATPGSATWCGAAALLGTASADLGDPDTTAQVCGEVLGSLNEPSGHAVMALADLCGALLAAGRYELRDQITADLAKLADGSSGADSLVAARVQKAMCFAAWSGQHLEDAIGHARAATVAAQRAGDTREALLCELGAAMLHTESGEFARAASLLGQIEVAAHAAGLRHLVAVVWLNQAVAHHEQGQHEEALALAQRALATFLATGNVRLQAGCRLALARILEAMGQLDDAERETRTALAILREVAHARCRGLGRLASILLHRSLIQEALQAAREAVQILTRLGSLDMGESHVRLVYAQALAAAGEREDAEAAIEAARGSLLARAARFESAERRAAFLARRTDNVPTLALARELLGEGQDRRIVQRRPLK